MLSGFSYGIGLLICELLFLYRFPRRRFFPCRLLAAAILTLLGSYVVHLIPYSHPVWIFLTMLGMIVCSMAGMIFPFQSSPSRTVSACVAALAVQHIGYHLYRMASLIPALRVPEGGDSRTELGILLLFVALFWLLGGKRLSRQEYTQEYDSVTRAVAIVIVFICIGISRFLRLAGNLNAYATICTSLYAITCCVLALFVQYSLQNLVKVKTDYVTFAQLAKKQMLQYETSHENAQLLNMKYHDLKHKLIDIEHSLPKEELDSMWTLLEDFDQAYHTGVDALDVVLGEKSLLCRAKGISLTLMGNARLLGFMKTMDLYALFGNLLENAIEAVEHLEPAGRRQISIVIESHGDYVYVNCMNYTDASLTLGPDGLPETSKQEQPGYHGFGVRSIRHIAHQYGGEIHISAEEDLFSLSILLSPKKAG